MAKSGAGSETPPKFFDEIDAVLGTRAQTRQNVTLNSVLDKTVKTISDTDENHAHDALDTTASELISLNIKKLPNVCNITHL